MIALTAMTIQIIDNNPDGIRICRVDGESLVTVVVPRDMLSEAKSLPDLPDRGVYYLLDEDHGVLSRAYVGQTTKGLSRLDAHKTKKDFWNKAIDYVDKHGSYETDNEYTPAPRMNPYKEQQVERLHNNILFRMRVLGYDLDRKEKTPVMVNAVFHTKKNGVQATGRYSQGTGRFTVLSGSEVDLVHPVIKNQGAVAARQHLFGTQTGKATLADDIGLSSPSAAAVFVLGGSQNGWTEWVNEQGQTLDYVYRNKEHMNE